MLRAIVVSREIEAKELVVGPDAFDADEFLHPALKRRVNSTESGFASLAADLGLAFLQIATFRKFGRIMNAIRQREDQNPILNEKTTYSRTEDDLIILAKEQAALIHKMANDVNLACGEDLMEAVIEQSDKLKGFNRDADPLSGIVGPTQAVYKRYKSKLDGIQSGKFKEFFEKNGCERLHLFYRDKARKHFRRHGDGEIEENVYVFHPKRDGVLVPIETYHKDLLAELHREFVLALGKLGAQSLTIETVAGMTFSAGADSKGSKNKKTNKLVKNPASGYAQYEKGENEELKVRWGSPTYDPGNAMEGCCLVQDKIGDMTLLKQRTTSDVVEYEKNYSIDTTFGVGIKVVQLIDANFKWEAKTEYKLVVEFFSKKEIPAEKAKAKEDSVQSATRTGSESV